MGEPHFPPPPPRGSNAPYRASDPAAAPSASPPPPPPAPAKIVVTRPEPPPESAAPAAKKGERPKLTKEEVRAFLAVTEATRPKPWGRFAARSGVILVPTGAIGFLLNMVLGKYSTVFVVFLTLGALAWAARPLYGKDSSDWG